jgi:dimethylargininase
LIALVREVSPRMGACELTHVTRSAINLEAAKLEHDRYTRTLAQLGATVRYLPALADFPDSVFVEDTAVVLPEIAIATRPGVDSRQGEVPSCAAVLEQMRPVIRLSAPACLEGGDVLRVGRTIYAGLSSRSNPAGVSALRQALQPFGYVIQPLEVENCLHLKSACTFVPPHFIIANPAWVDVEAFREWTLIPVDDEEPFGANTLAIGALALVSASYPRTELRLRKAGIATRSLDISQLHKAEAGLSCLSIIA